MAEDLWYYEKDGKQHGPVSQTELEGLIGRGEITREHLAWKPGETDWSETGSFEMLIPSFKTPPQVKRGVTPPPLPPPIPSPLPSAASPSAQTERVSSSIQSHAGSQGFTGSEVQTGSAGTQAMEKRGPRNSGSKEKGWFLKFGSAVSFLALKKILDRYLFTPWRWRIVLVLALLLSLSVTYIVIVKVAPNPAPTSLAGVRVPAGYKGPVGQIKIDAYPWAELTRLVSAGDGELTVPGSQITPLVLLVAPGDYRIEFGGASCEVDVDVEQIRTCSKVVRSVDAAAYYREVGW